MNDTILKIGDYEWEWIDNDVFQEKDIQNLATNIDRDSVELCSISIYLNAIRFLSVKNWVERYFVPISSPYKHTESNPDRVNVGYMGINFVFNYTQILDEYWGK